MNDKLLILNGTSIELEDFIVSQTMDMDYKISIQSKDPILHKIILEQLGTLKHFTLIDENKKTIVRDAKVTMVHIATNLAESDYIKFIATSVSHKDNPYTEYKKSVLALLKLYDDMYSGDQSQYAILPVFQLSGFRRHGNTTILLEIAKKYKNQKQKVVIVSATEELNRQMQKQTSVQCTSLNNHVDYLRGKIVDVVLFDNYSMMDKNKVVDIMRILDRRPALYTKYIGLN